jgi:glucose/arabinose dehydrogenase
LKRRASLILFCFSLAPASTSLAQAPPPIGFAPRSLTEGEYVFETAEQREVRVTVVIRGLVHPWSLALLPTGDALVSERGQSVRFVHDVLSIEARLDPMPLGGFPALEPARAKGGIHDIVLHPQFSENNLVYFTFHRAHDAERDAFSSSTAPIVLSLLRGRLIGTELAGVEEIYAGGMQSPTGSRLTFGSDGMIYLATGVNFYDAQSQDLTSANGKILRLNEDGSVPRDNPFVGRNDALPEVYSYGHSTQYGLAVHPESGSLLATENGANGGDELNLILPGRNYGWPAVSFGRRYDGTPMSDSPVGEGIEPPIMAWVPSMTPSGLVFYTGDQFPRWKGNMFFGVIRRGEISGTGGLERVVFNDGLGEVRSESMLTELRQRVRDVRQGPDGLLYILTDENDSALLRLEPL